MHGSTGVRWNVARESAQGSGRRWMRRGANVNNRVFGGEQNQTKKTPSYATCRCLPVLERKVKEINLIRKQIK